MKWPHDRRLALTRSCNFWTSAAMWTSCLVDSEAGPPPSLPVSSTDVLLEVDDAELGRGLLGSLLASGAVVLLSACSQSQTVKQQVLRWPAMPPPPCPPQIKRWPRSGRWRIASRAAAWASRSDEPAAAGRLGRTSSAPGKTTTTPSPAGGTRRRLRRMRTQNVSERYLPIRRKKISGFRRLLNGLF